METAYPDPSQTLPFEFKINRQADIYFTLLQDGAAISSVTGWTWALRIKKNPGDRLNVIELTLGFGLSYDTYSDIVLHAHFTSAQTKIQEGEYFIELIRTDIEKTWIESTKCNFRYAKKNSQDTMSSELTIDVSSTTQAISLNVVSGRIITVGSTPSLQTAYNNGQNIVLQSGKPLRVFDTNGTTKLLSVDPDTNFIEIDSGSLLVGQTTPVPAVGFNASSSLDIRRSDNSVVFNISSSGLNLAATATALTDGSSIALTRYKHTLTTTQATITFTDSHTGDFQIVEVIFNRTGATWTFPANSLCKYVDASGTTTTSGDNTLTISGATSGDRIILMRSLVGSNRSWIAVNFGQ